MAVCTKCGKELAEGEVCSCETTATEASAAETTATETVATEAPATEAPVNEAPAAEQTAPAADTTTEKKKGNQTVMFGAIAAAVVVLIIIIVAVTSKPYMKPLKTFMKQINAQNTSYIELNTCMMPAFGSKAYNKVVDKMKKSDEFVDDMEDSADDYADYYEAATDEYGKWKLSFEVTKTSKIDEDDFEDIQEYIEDYYKNNYMDDSVDFYEDLRDDDDDLEDWSDNQEVTEKEGAAILDAVINYYNAYKELEATDGYEVKGKFIIKAADDEFDTKIVKLYMVKVNGDWCYYTLADGNVNFDGDDDGYFNFIERILNSGKFFNYFSFY